MTIAQALNVLNDKFPKKSFKVGLEVWHWEHYSPPLNTVEWSVSIVDDFYRARTLKLAVLMALKPPETMETTEAVAASVEEIA